MNTSTSLGPFSFDDFLKTPTTASGNDGTSLSFSLVPPTPHDVRNRPFPSPGDLNQFAHSSMGPGLPFDIASPPPFGGIMSPKYEQQHDSLRPQSGFRSTHTGEHKRNSSMTSQGHRHEPYKSASRQSSISSLSGVVQGSDGASSDWQWESSAEPEAFSSSPLSNAGLSICPADLQVKPAALQPQRPMTFFAPQTPLRNSDYADDGDDSDVPADLKPEDPHSRKPRANIPAPIRPTTPGARSKIQLATATTTWSRSSGATRTSRNSKPQKHYREESAAPDSPILVTAITSSGKKSHARKRPENHIPRPRNAFILFRKHVVDSKLIPPEVEIRHQNISVVVAKMWAEADASTKTRFQAEARSEKEKHMRDYPDYKYQPVYRRTGAPRRQIKADPVEVKKCTLVANLLLDGKKGDELKKEAKKAVERSNKKRAKVAKSLAEARARNNQARRHSRMYSESQSLEDSDDYQDATDVEEASDRGVVTVPESRRYDQNDTPTTLYAAPSAVSQLRHQFSGQDFMQSTSVSRLSQQTNQVASSSATRGNNSYMYQAENMVFDPQEILALNQDHEQQQNGMQSFAAPPSHYVLAMHEHNVPAELQYVQQMNYNMPMPQMQMAEQAPLAWPAMSDEDLLGYADAFNMLGGMTGQPWPNMS